MLNNQIAWLDLLKPRTGPPSVMAFSTVVKTLMIIGNDSYIPSVMLC